jgi:acetoin utilization deacetylase AcuC-like enzyme
MTIYYSDTYTVDLPPEHRFPMEKYRLLRDTLLAEHVVDPSELYESPPATRDQLVLAHTADYVDALTDGSVDPLIVRRIGIPWSPEFARRSYASVGGTIAASRAALRDGIAGNLAGGTHHAMRDRGEGYCVFNDIATAALLLLAEDAVRRVAVVDLDVHQGNGTADILGNDRRVFTLSLHGEKNFPFTKVSSTLDIGLADGTGDDEYLAALAPALERVRAFEPDIVFYQAGVDPLECDRLGRLSLTHDGLMERDRRVLSAFGCPLVLTLGGGYAVPISETVRGHVNTYRVVKSF